MWGTKWDFSQTLQEHESFLKIFFCLLYNNKKCKKFFLIFSKKRNRIYKTLTDYTKFIS